MKYFAKYLPVEGEIKIGDYFFNGMKNLSLATKETFKNSDEENEKFAKENWKKVKLFLCSRDIQVGDKAYCLETEEENKELNLKEGDSQWVDPWCVKGDCNFCVKVLGEISPKATWVKEGDEFDEEEIHIHFRDIYVGMELYFDTEIQEESTREYHQRVDTVYIKGPCGHFH